MTEGADPVEPVELSEEAKIAAIQSSSDKLTRAKTALRDNHIDDALDLLSDALKLRCRYRMERV